MTKRNRTNQRLEEITTNTLIVGVDIAKNLQYARFVDYRGKEVSKVLSFNNDKDGFEAFISKIKDICKTKNQFSNVIIGMEPTGHYWKTLAYYLMERKYKVVGVNPYHTKRAKELDDNSPTKCDKKDAITIARLVKDGRYFIPYLAKDIYSDIRMLTNTRVELLKTINSLKNRITAMLDQYFPEIRKVFRDIIDGKAVRQILKICPFPKMILELGETGVLKEIKKAVKRGVGIKRVKKLIEVSETSIGLRHSLETAKLRLNILINELELMEQELLKIEGLMDEKLRKTGYYDRLISIDGVGVVSACSFLGEIGCPLRFSNARQIFNYAGLNLIEDSSGKNKSKTCISKRGRSVLRSILYQMSFTMVNSNAEMKQLYHYLKNRKVNPLKKKQALIVISKKIVTVMFNLIKKNESYKSDSVFGDVRKKMLMVV